MALLLGGGKTPPYDSCARRRYGNVFIDDGYSFGSFHLLGDNVGITVGDSGGPVLYR
ncbi:MAG: hypothetical protein KAI47_05830 [Deltaproteobacteria bacterium]|nr:hypothetical protein [Deltaproteobacteria bacterium]